MVFKVNWQVVLAAEVSKDLELSIEKKRACLG